MARLHLYAEPLTADHLSWKAYAAGITKTPPGIVLREILEHTGNVFEDKIEFSPTFCKRALKLAAFTHDEELKKIAEAGFVTISLEHLRDVDPDTRIALGCHLNYTPEESEFLGLEGPEVVDPKTSLLVHPDPENPQRAR